MLRSTFARLRSVRVRITVVATVLTGVALTVAAVMLVSAVERRLEDQIRTDTQSAASRVAVAVQSGQPVDLAARSAAAGGTLLWIVNDSGQVVAVGPGTLSTEIAGVAGSPEAQLIRSPQPFEVAYQSAVGTAGPVNVVAASPLADVQRSVAELSRLLWVGIPVLVVLVGALAWVLVGRALKPVDSLREEVDEISHSTLHRRVAEPVTGDEVGRLARPMNAMLDRLEGSAGRQRQFVSDASHELRSPLATIRAKVEVATMHPELADWPAVSDTVLSEIDRLDDLVGDLLQLARLDETGGRLAARSEVDLDELATAEVMRLRAVGIAVDDAGVSAARVLGDRGALGRVVRNLADNAARHATARVAVSVGREGGDAVLRVDDDGSGVAVADRERVFERFTRLDEGRWRGAGGAGLGLALVRAVATAHGGTVAVLDAPLGGARFEVRLPADAA